MSVPIPAIGFRSMVVRETADVELGLFVRILADLNIAYTVDGKWVDRNTDPVRYLRDNHLKCMVLHEYRRVGGELSGAMLQKKYRAFCTGMARVARLRWDEYRDEERAITTVQVDGSFL